MTSVPLRSFAFASASVLSAASRFGLPLAFNSAFALSSASLATRSFSSITASAPSPDTFAAADGSYALHALAARVPPSPPSSASSSSSSSSSSLSLSARTARAPTRASASSSSAAPSSSPSPPRVPSSSSSSSTVGRRRRRPRAARRPRVPRAAPVDELEPVLRERVVVHRARSTPRRVADRPEMRRRVVTIRVDVFEAPTDVSRALRAPRPTRATPRRRRRTRARASSRATTRRPSGALDATWR